MNWLFLRGLARHQKHWAGFTLRFENEVPGAQVHCLDLPGFGTEAHRPSPSSISEIRMDLQSRWLEIANQLPSSQIDQPWRIFAFSLGGLVTLDWLAHDPDPRIEGAILLNTSAKGLSPFWRRIRPSAYTDLAQVVRFNLGARSLARERQILKLTTRLLSSTQIEELAREFANFAPLQFSTAAALAQLKAAAQFSAPEKITPPLAILGAKRDGLVHPSCPAALAKKYAALFFEHTEAGHDLVLDDPQWVLARVRDWLSFRSP